MNANRSRNLLFALLLPAIALAGYTATADAAQQSASTRPLRWSDPATWPGRKVPQAGDKVTIEQGRTVVLDVSPPPLNGLSIDGKLVFSNDKDIELTTEWIMLHGELEIGTPERPHTKKATITLTDNVKGEEVMAGMGDRGIMISGGTLNLHGDRGNSWTKLAKTAEAGTTTIEVLDASEWRVGDEIVLASTDFDPRQAERRTIRAISGNTITLDAPLEFMHFGKITFDVDERGEVGLLTRNIKIQASEDAEQSYFGGHIMAMPTSRMYVSGVELNRMGQHLTLARYPIHWHLVGDAHGQYIRNSAIHDTYNRCVTVHGTNHLRVENNVTYNNVGHCFFVEDGIEHSNYFVRNLAIQTKCHPTRPCQPTNLAAAGEMADFDQRNGFRSRGQRSVSNGHTDADVLLPSDNTVASFWITNPANHYIDNVAAGSDANGFWLSLPEHPNGQFLGTEISLKTWPRRTQLREFRGNVAHSNYDGFMFDRNINEDNTFGVTGNMHVPRANPEDPNSPMLETLFLNLTAYKNRNGGFWARGEVNTIINYKAADNAIGYTHASGLGGGEPWTSKVISSLFVGETENIGNPRTPEEKAYGRSLPKPVIPDFPIRGYEYYDLRHEVIDTTFVNFQDNAQRRAGAISYLLFTSFGVSTENTIEKVRFINAKPADFPPMQRKWGNDNGTSVAWKTAAFKDIDGSLGYGPNAYVLIHDGVNDSVAVDEQACEIKRDWNAAVCRGDVGRLNFGGPFGGGGAPRGAGPGGPPRAGGPAASSPASTLAGAQAPAAPGVGAFTGPGTGAPPRGFGQPAAPQPPIVLERNGREYNLTERSLNGTNVRAGTEIRVKTERPELNLSLAEMDTGSWVILELPGYKSAAAGAEVNSLDALRQATTTSYYRSRDGLWVKLVATPDGGRRGGASLVVSR